MSKKLYGLLLPVLAVLAFAGMSGAAQAAPHWWNCHEVAAGTGKFTDPDCTKAGAGNYELTRLPFTSAKTPVVTFGTLTLTVGADTITCRVSDAGNVWNTLISNPGLDEIVQFQNYACTIAPAAACTAGLELTASGLPWSTELNEVEEPVGSGKFVLRDKIKGIKVTFKCTAPMAINEVFEGELNPKFTNNSPSFVEFDAAAGHLTSAHLGNGTVGGKDKILGFENGEQIQVFNP